jgi:ribosomal-protein-alanine N-acetyltransferase
MSGPLSDRRTERLRLRRVQEGDVADLVRLSVDPRVNEHRPGGAPSEPEATRIVRGFISDWERTGFGYWVAEYHASIAGIAGVRPVTLGTHTCWNLYYRFAPEVQGRGLASEAAREAIRAAAEHTPGWIVVARTRPANAAAVKLALGIGMSRRADLDADGLITYAA